MYEIEKLITDNYKQISTHNMIFNFDMGGLLYMEYYDIESDIHIDLSKTDDESSYIANIINKDNSKSINILNPNRNFFELINFNKTSPVFHCYENAKTKMNDLYKLDLKMFSIDIELYLEKIKAVMEMPDSRCLIYKKNNEGKINMNADKPVEVYQFFKNGYFCSNISESIDTIYSNNILVDYKLFKSKKLYYHFSMLDILPTLVEFNQGDKYRIYYDEAGVITNCINLSNPKRILCRYNCTMHDNDDVFFITIYPLLCDYFKPSNIDKPLKYWVIDKYDFTDDLVNVNRDIYEVPEEYLNQLIDMINGVEH